MEKQTFIRMKKSLAILLVGLFLMTVTAVAVTATKDNFDPSWGPKSQAAYNNAYNKNFNLGKSAGI